MAGSVKLFSYTQKYCHIMGIHPIQTNQNSSSISSRNRICIISFVLFSLSSAAFFCFEAKSMHEYGKSFFTTSIILHLFIYLSTMWQMKNILTFIENCERFIEKRERSIISYRELIKKIELVDEFLGNAIFISVQIMTTPFLIYSLVNYYIRNLGAESFSLSFPVKPWPFDWKTPLGYSVAWIVQTAGLTVASSTLNVFLNLMLGSCWLFAFLADDITKDLANFNNDAKKSKANHAELMKRFVDIMQLYSDAKKCVNDFNAIVRYSLFIMIFFLMLSVSSALLILQFQFLDDDTKMLETFVVALVPLWVFGILFLVCELGERVDSHFDLFREELERCDWHTLPFEMQRMYLVFLSDSQQPKHIKCFGNILCTRDMFRRILNSGSSYFMIIRQFEV